MLIKQYRHRLPADYDMKTIHNRAQKGGPVFDKRDGLAFKAFSIEEHGKSGSQENAYSSLYLWFETNPVIDFLWYEGFQNVFDTFGRPQVDMWLAIDARKGRSNSATMLYRENVEVPYGMNLDGLRSSELEHSTQRAQDPNVVASVVGLDPTTWNVARFLLTENPVEEIEGSQVYQVAYLASLVSIYFRKGVNDTTYPYFITSRQTDRILQ